MSKANISSTLRLYNKIKYVHRADVDTAATSRALTNKRNCCHGIRCSATLCVNSIGNFPVKFPGDFPFHSPNVNHALAWTFDAAAYTL